MSTITLSLNGQSICFSLADVENIEAVLSQAARNPGQKAFHASSSGRLEAIVELDPEQSNHSQAVLADF